MRILGPTVQFRKTGMSPTNNWEHLLYIARLSQHRFSSGNHFGIPNITLNRILLDSFWSSTTTVAGVPTTPTQDHQCVIYRLIAYPLPLSTPRVPSWRHSQCGLKLITTKVFLQKKILLHQIIVTFAKICQLAVNLITEDTIML